MPTLDEILPAPETRPWPAELPQHLSQTSLSMFERCAEQWRRRYVLGEKERPSSTLMWGRADSQAAAHNFVQKVESHEDLPVGEVELAFAHYFDAAVEDEGGAGEVDWRDDKPGEVKDRGVALAATYHRQVAPRVQPTAAEEGFELDVAGVPVPVIGFIDVSTAAYSIERKTAAQKSNVIPPQYRLQTLMYALARRKPVEVHISTRTQRPAVWTPREEPELEQHVNAELLDRAEHLLTMRARTIIALYDRFGPDGPWPDAIGTMAWHMPVCDLCGWGPKGTNACEWWR